MRVTLVLSFCAGHGSVVSLSLRLCCKFSTLVGVCVHDVLQEGNLIQIISNLFCVQRNVFCLPCPSKA